MKRYYKLLLWGYILPLFLYGCTNEDIENRELKNSIYHWKTSFAPDSTELEFLRKHNIKRIYLRMFDVAEEKDELRERNIVPIATTKIKAKIPDGIEVVPVTYITIDALRALNYENVHFYATNIEERLLAMCSYNKCGKIKEVQIDCDWTKTTKSIYSHLCQLLKTSLNKKNIDLSITVRLHQLNEPAPPADRGVLMLYNTGAIKNINTKNSILDINDVKPYIKKRKYSIPLDYAYPMYGWGIKFHNNTFANIVSEDYKSISQGESVRVERATANEIQKVQKLVESNLGKPYNGNILYHLDYSQLKHYTDNEINSIINY